MKKLFNVKYQMDMGCGKDIWRIFGIDETGNPIFTSIPVSFDINTNTFKTISGSIYQIVTYDGNKQNFIDQINKDIANKTFEIH